MGLSKRERQEKREAKLARKRTEKRSERNAIRASVSDYLAGAPDALDVPAGAGKRAKAFAGPSRGTVAPDRPAPRERPRRELSLEEIGPCRHRIPRSARPFMRVPAILVADEALLRDLRHDPALEQLANAASLPGIVGWALAMPDCHHGYGFPVGGVAATRARDGVVSPGAIGYDINCLSSSARVRHEFGYTRPIVDFDGEWVGQRIACVDPDQGVRAADIRLFLRQRRPASGLIRVCTESGREVTATADHPFLARDGMRPLRELLPGDDVALVPFDGIPYEPPSDEVLVDEERIAEVYPGGANGLAQVLRLLRQRALLPLRLNDPRLPHLVKLLGLIEGDGTLHFLGKGGALTGLYGDPEDLEDVRGDVSRIGFTPSRIYRRTRAHTIETRYDRIAIEREEASVYCGSMSLALLLVCLGATAGNKSRQDVGLPPWLGRAPRWMRRLFLAAYFGAELSTPAAEPGHGSTMTSPILSVSRGAKLGDGGRDFLEGVRDWLRDFDVESTVLDCADEHIGRRGNLSVRRRLQISGRAENLIRLWSQIGFEYNHRKQHLAAVAVHYVRAKRLVLALRETAAATALSLRHAGVGATEIVERLGCVHGNRRFLERSLWERRATPVWIGAQFPTFEEFEAECTAGLGRTGRVWDRIIRCETVESEPVYDFTVGDPNHNFVANSFVVSNCGVRLLRTPLREAELERHRDRLADGLAKAIPAGIGVREGLELGRDDMAAVLAGGARWCLANGLATEEDVASIESGGRLDGADPDAVSRRAVDRGLGQLGTLGSGNHFCEVQVVDELFDEDAARAMGLELGQVCVFVHSGSRGLGHQVCQDSLDEMVGAMRRLTIELPDKQLACAPIDSPEGRRYLGAMQAAANFAFANRQGLTHRTREAFKRVFGPTPLALVYDVAHNIAKFERYEVDGVLEEVLVHRKGATRAFPARHPEIPGRYAEVGQPVLIPGDMGRYSFVAVGTEAAMRDTFGSICHGAGRQLSRSAARQELGGVDLVAALAREGISVRAASPAALAEEASIAYKDVANVVDVCERAGIARKVARLRPRVVVKG